MKEIYITSHHHSEMPDSLLMNDVWMFIISNKISVTSHHRSEMPDSLLMNDVWTLDIFGIAHFTGNCALNIHE